MRNKQSIKNMSLVLFVAVLSLACGGAIIAPTATRVPTSAPAPTNTATPRPSPTPLPTATEIPPTPAHVGETVANDKYEVTVVKARKLDTAYLDTQYQWVANPGYLFVELGVKVRSLGNGEVVQVPWNQIGIEDSKGGWYPQWGAYKAVERGVEIRPTSLIFAEIVNSDESVVFTDVVFLRLIWTTPDKNPSIILFGFDDAPLIQITID